MGTLITSEGVQKLIEMKNRGEKLPDGWKKDVSTYVSFKQKIMEKWFIEYTRACELYDKALKKERYLHGFKDRIYDR